MVASDTPQAKESFLKRTKDKVFGFFTNYNFEQTEDKEYAVHTPGTFTLNNFDGNITVRTNWNQNAVCVKATKRTNKEEMLPDIRVKSAQQKENGQDDLTIATVYGNDNVKGQVDYELIVPSDMRLQLTTKRGTITVNDVNGSVAASTTHGNIEINNTTQLVVAQTQKSGSILIKDSKGPIQANTHNGNITIKDASDNIVACAERGTINSICSAVPQTGRIKLETASGSIVLALPSEANATIRGRTEKGTLMCDHYVQLETRATKLNRRTWNQFKKEIDGMLGSGEANIELSCKSGNIKILETKTT
jgi:hypothetical protein